jgi:hypothetical protein
MPKPNSVQSITQVALFVVILAISRLGTGSFDDMLIPLFVVLTLVFLPLFYFSKYQPFWLYIKSDTNVDLSKSADIALVRSEGLTLLLTLSYCMAYSGLITFSSLFIISKTLVTFSFSAQLLVNLLMYVILSSLFFRTMRYLAIKLNQNKKLRSDS